MRLRRHVVLLLALLAVAAALRLWRLGDEPWLDEIDTHLRVSRLGLVELASTYPSQNQHVLYSLLARLSIDLLGDSTAAVRVPAVLFGVLSVAATYLVGNALLSRREALGGAALLAVSDVHVWFSQNARGYTALLFLTLLSSRLLLHALHDDRRRTWAAWGATLALGSWVHLTMAFVAAGHAALIVRRRIAGAADADVRRAGLRGPALGIALAGGLAALLYAPIARDVLAVTAVEGRSGAVPEWSSTGWAVRETAERVRESFPRPWLALAALGCGIAGVAAVARRSPALLELFLVPVAVGLAVVVASGHHLWPRLFFFACGFAALVTSAGAIALGEGIARRLVVVPATVACAGNGLMTVAYAGNTAVALLVAAVALAAPGAYGPKQRYAEALAVIDRLAGPADAISASGPAARVFREAHGRPWPAVRTVEDLDGVRAGGMHTWLVHSFPILLRRARPDVARALDRDFELVARLEGTLRGGEVLIWRTRTAPPVAPPAAAR